MNNIWDKSSTVWSKKKLPILNLALSTFLNFMITITRSSKFKAEHHRRTRKDILTLCRLIGYECNFFLLRFLYSVTPFLNDPRKKVGTSYSWNSIESKRLWKTLREIAYWGSIIVNGRKLKCEFKEPSPFAIALFIITWTI